MLFITFICISSVGYLNIKHHNSQICIQNTVLMQKTHKIVVIVGFFLPPSGQTLCKEYILRAALLSNLFFLICLMCTLSY